MKTASRIVGTAAFRQGFFAQDSPIYGAERRGAPMIAFTRFDSSPILERGIVSSPDMVVVADASLLADPLVRPLQGLPRAGPVLLNSTGSLHCDIGIPITADFTGLALRHAGTSAALSVALGAAAAKLAGLAFEFIDEAVREELHELKLDGIRLEKNIQLARSSFDVVPNVAISPVDWSRTSTDARVIDLAYDGAWTGTASVACRPNTSLRKTGDWRVMRPVIDADRCTHCWICFVDCPDGAITLGTGDMPQIDYNVCKGCLICGEECPRHAIETVREGVSSI
jgi:pyruvate ferredoxin oxidoreductase gamma subunit